MQLISLPWTTLLKTLGLKTGPKNPSITWKSRNSLWQRNKLKFAFCSASADPCQQRALHREVNIKYMKWQKMNFQWHDPIRFNEEYYYYYNNIMRNIQCWWIPALPPTTFLLIQGLIFIFFQINQNPSPRNSIYRDASLHVAISSGSG